MKISKTTLILTTVCVATILLSFSASALLTWSQNVSWNRTAPTNFSVWSDASAQTPASTSVTVSNPDQPLTTTYYIKNDGAAPITVTGSVAFPQGSATVAWNPTSGSVAVPVGQIVAIALTLSSFSFGQGSATVTFQ